VLSFFPPPPPPPPPWLTTTEQPPAHARLVVTIQILGCRLAGHRIEAAVGSSKSQQGGRPDDWAGSSISGRAKLTRFLAWPPLSSPR